MAVIVSCPNCKTRYQLSDAMLGKSIKCKSCGTAFQTKASSKTAVAAGTARPSTATSSPNRTQPAAGELAKFGLNGPLRRQSTDVFAGASPISRKGPDILGNHASEPGFADLETIQRQLAEESDDGPVVQEAEFLQNPALRSDQVKKRNSSGSKSRKKKKAGPFYYQPWFMLLVGLPTLLMLVLLVALISPTVGGYGLAGFYWLVIIASALVSLWNLAQCMEAAEESSERVLFLLVPFYAIYFWIKYWRDIWPSAMAWLSFWITIPTCILIVFLYGFMVEEFPPVPGFGGNDEIEEVAEANVNENARIPILKPEFVPPPVPA